MTEPSITTQRRRPKARLAFFAVFGPGIVVMLADTDVGSIITAGQSGVQWGYKLLLLQVLLMPILYIVQELTVRLGIFTGRGHGELIRSAFGPIWAWVSADRPRRRDGRRAADGILGRRRRGRPLWRAPRIITLPLAAAALARDRASPAPTGGWSGLAIIIGLFEFAFFGVAWAARPDHRRRSSHDSAVHPDRQ